MAACSKIDPNNRLLEGLRPFKSQEENNNFDSYRIKKNEEGYITVVLQCLISLVGNRQEAKIIELMQQSKNNNKTYKVKFNSAIQECAQFLYPKTADGTPTSGYGPFLYPVDSHGLSFTGILDPFLVKDYDLTPEEVSKANDFAVNFIEENLKDFTLEIKKPEEFFEFGITAKTLYSEYWRQNGSRRGQMVDSYFVKGGIVGAISCVTFAFLYVKDNDFIAQNENERTPQGFFRGQHQGYFEKLKYQPVEIPAVNDLVAYFEDDTDHSILKFTHLAVNRGNGKVLSKKGGIFDPYIYEHDIDKVPGIYGSVIRFYRKTV